MFSLLSLVLAAVMLKALSTAVITFSESCDIWLAVSRRLYQATTAGTSCAIGSSSV